MAGIQRFITYIYAYENGEKMNNAGYAKVETRGKEGRVEIHFIDGGVSGKAEAAFLLIQNREAVEIPLGEIQVENGRGIARFVFRTDGLSNTEIPFDEIDGIGIIDANRQRYMSFWKDVDVQKIQFMISGEMKSEENLQQKEEQTEERKEKIKAAELESLHSMEISAKNVFPNDSIEDIWQNMKKGRDCVKFGRNICALQIELGDLRELPKRYWYLGNNSFLLHGFFNYKHLLFGKHPDGTWFLGVPGIYERQERVMASIFNFGGFLPLIENNKENAEAEEQPAEKAAPGQQGVWYHVLEEQ